jgi:superfamily II DNA or RNA helicase
MHCAKIKNGSDNRAMEHLVGQIVQGPFWREIVRVLDVQEVGDWIKLKLEGIESRRIFQINITKNDLNQLKPVTLLWDGKGNAEKAFLALEAQRIRLAYLFDPFLAVTVSQIDPLPHQIEAVYHYILRNPRIRFLLADDPGAGKTIMAGLVLKELKYRGLIDRILIVVPGHLRYQWQREMKEKFNEKFVIVDRQFIESNLGHNVWQEFPQVITSMDFAKQEEILKSLREVNWDLVIVDEAHKMAAYRYGQKMEQTDRYRLGEVLSPRTHFMLFLTATPHKGDPENFRLLLELLEPGMFPTAEVANKLLSSGDHPIFLRRLKEDLCDFEGSPLFPERVVHTICYRLSEVEKQLYNKVTEYVRKHYKRADERKRHGVGFAMLVLQRRMASSTKALLTTLKNRYQRLSGALNLDWEKFLKEQQEISSEVRDEHELEDKEEKERQKIENKAVYNLTNAENIDELREEIEELERLIELAKEIVSNNRETKLAELQRVLNDEKLKEKGVKLLIFTEARETLEYLAEKLRDWGFSVTTLHGNMSMEERIKAEQEFKEKTQIMVSTEAGGEGINLQFCWLMVNYDIPWNPNRLDQRIGRIHRYGQRHNVHVYNLVAEDTIEGRILKTLQEKLQTIREALGSDRVFDVLGDIVDIILQGRSLKDLIIEAISNPVTLDDIIACIGKIPNDELIEMVRSVTLEMLAKRHIDLSRIKGESEQARENRLIPEYIERFFLRACKSLNITVKPRRERGVFQIEWVPAGVRDALKNRYGEVDTTYRSFTFHKELATDTVEFVAPGHPLLEAVVELAMAQGKNDMQRGACFYDPRRRWDGWLWIVEGEIVDGRQTVVGKRLFAVYQPKEGQPIPVNSSTLWDLCPVPPEELEGISVELPVETKQETILHLPDLPEPVNLLILQELDAYRSELKAEKDRFALVKRQYTIPALKALINEQEAKVADLLFRESKGEKVELPLQNERRRLDELEKRLRELEESLVTETTLVIGGVNTIAVLRVIPLPEQKSEEEMVEDPTLEAIGLQVAMEYERREGRSPTDVSIQRLGYDIKSRAQDGSVRYIEVKTRAHTGSVALTEHEWLKAKQLGDSYWLYVVENAVTNPTLWIIQNPAEKLEPKATVIQYIVRDWKNAAQPAYNRNWE